MNFEAGKKYRKPDGEVFTVKEYLVRERMIIDTNGGHHLPSPAYEEMKTHTAEFILIDFGDGGLTEEEKKVRDKKRAEEEWASYSRRVELLNLLDINRYVLKSLGRSGRSKAVLAAAKNWNTYNRFIESRIDHIKTNDLFNGYIQIWREGYMATGEHGTACFCGLYKAESFDDAMVMYDEDMNRIYPNEKDRAPKYKNDRGNWISWGCRFYDNEADARKGFG